MLWASVLCLLGHNKLNLLITHWEEGFVGFHKSAACSVPISQKDFKCISSDSTFFFFFWYALWVYSSCEGMLQIPLIDEPTVDGSMLW